MATTQDHTKQEPIAAAELVARIQISGKSREPWVRRRVQSTDPQIGSLT